MARVVFGELDPRVVKLLRKKGAIARIKAQPFFRPHDGFYMGAQWSLEMIQALHAADRAKLEINRICGVKP